MEAEDLRAVGERARGREWREGPAETAVIGEGIGVASGRVELDESRRVVYSAGDM